MNARRWIQAGKSGHLTALLLATCALAGSLIAIALASQPENRAASGGRPDDSAANLALHAPRTGSSSELSTLHVFEEPATDEDRLPDVLRNDIDALNQLSGGQVQGRYWEGRRLGQASTELALYAWPSGDNGLCLGIPYLMTRCFTTVAPSPVPAALVAPSGGATVIAGLAEDGVQAIALRRGDHALCNATVERNGFVCVVSDAVSADDLTLRVEAWGKAGRTYPMPP